MIAFFLVTGCGKASSVQSGEPPCKAPPLPLEALLANPESLNKETRAEYKWLKLLRQELGPDKALEAFLTRAVPAEWKGSGSEVRVLWERAARDPERAEPLFTEARRLSLALHDETLLTRTDLKLAVRMLGQSPRKAAALLEAVVKRAQQLKPDQLGLYPKALINLGLARMKLDRYDETIELSRQAEDLLESGECADRATAELNIGWSWMQLGEEERAFEHTRRAEDLFENLHRPDTAALRNLARYYVAKKQFASAQKELDAALKAAGSSVAEQIGPWADRAEVAVLAGDLEGAERAVKEAARLLNFQGEIRSHDDAHIVFVQSQIDEGRQRKENAAAGYRRVFDADMAWSSMRLEAARWRAGLLAQDNREEAAQRQFQDAAGLLQKMRESLRQDESKLKFFENSSALFDRYVDFLVRQKKYGEALQVADRSRARLLSDYQTDANWKELELAGLKRQLGNVKAVALFYWLGTEHSYLFIVEPGEEVRLEELPARPERLRELAEGYAKAVASGLDMTRVQRNRGCELRQAILGRASRSLTPGRRVFMVLDGPLGLINPESLPSAACNNPQAWFIHEANISVAPSLAVLQSPAPARTQKGRKLLAIGDADGTEEYPKLKYAADELALVVAQVGVEQSKMIRGGEATPAAYLRGNPGQYEMLHFTAHGESTPNNPLDSAVILSADPETKVLKLYARDIVGERIRARLVTISACRSALSRTYRGEGAVGLAWAFLRAGAGQVVAGLWNVDDESAKELMPRFYAGMKAGLRPAEALRQAKLELMKGFPKPYDWAVFEIFAGSIEGR